MISEYAGFWLSPSLTLNTGAGPVEREFANGVKVWVRSSGLIVFDFAKWPLGRAPRSDDDDLEAIYLARSQFMNCVAFGFAMTLDKCGRDSHIPYVTPDDHVHFADPADDPMGRQAQRTRLHEVPEGAVVGDALELTQAIVQADLVMEAGLLMRGIEDQRRHAPEAALSATWPVVERLLTRVWLAYLDANKRRSYPPGVVVGGTSVNGERVDTSTYEFIGSRRRDTLTNHDTFTAATIAEVLNLVGEIDFEAYRSISRARKARNGWLHDLRPVDRLDAEAAFDAISALATKLHGLSFEIRVGGFLSGFSSEEYAKRRASLEPDI